MAHEEIYRELEEAKGTQGLVAYHRWGDDPSIFLVGRVRELTPTLATFEDIDTHGQTHGEVKVPLRLIHTIDQGTHYLWRLQVLGQIGSPEVETREATKPPEVRALLEEAAREGSSIRIWTSVHEAGDYAVHGVGDETVSISEILDGGPGDGRTLMRLKRIKRVRFGRSERNNTDVHRYGLNHGFPKFAPRSAQ